MRERAVKFKGKRTEECFCCFTFQCFYGSVGILLYIVTCCLPITLKKESIPQKIHPPAKHSLVFQVFIKFMTIFLLFYVLAFWHVGSYLPDQGLNPTPLHWKAKSQPLTSRQVLTTQFLIFKASKLYQPLLSN